MDNSAKKWRIAFFLTIAAALPLILFFAYSALDQGITITCLSQGYAETEEDLARLAKIFPKNAYTKKDIVVLLRQHNPEAFIVETSCTVELQNLRFEFDGKGRLLNINTKAQSSPDYECKNT